MRVFAVAAAFGMPNRPNGFLALGTHVAASPEIASAFVVDIFRQSNADCAPLEGVAVMEISEAMARAMVAAYEANATAAPPRAQVVPFKLYGTDFDVPEPGTVSEACARIWPLDEPA